MLINEERCKEFTANSTALSTIISSICGYKTATKIARHAYEKGVSVKTAAMELGVLNQAQADEILDPFAMTDPALSDAIVKKFKGKI